MQKHPVGDYKILLIKLASKFLNKILIFFLSLILKIDKNKSEIIISNALLAPWKYNENFKKNYEKIKEFTILDIRRLFTIWTYTESVKDLDGNILDLGCLNGGAGFLMSLENNKGNTYLFDTFEGYVDEEKFFNKGFKYTNIENVSNRIKKLKLENTEVFKGIFPECANQLVSLGQIKLCHLDLNTYNSTKNSFLFVKDRLIKNGILIFDDYGTYGAEKIVNLVDELKLEYFSDFNFFFNYQGQAILIKK